MRRVRIALDPVLKERSGAELCWAWRLLLSGIGLPWEEVPAGGECDIAYVQDPGTNARARLSVRAAPELWDRRSSLRLEASAGTRGWRHPLYAGETAQEPLTRAAGGGVVCQRDILFDVYWLVAGWDERHRPRDRHGHLDFSQATREVRETPRRALASSIGCSLEKTLAELGLPPALPRWPDGKRAAACVGHDVDYPDAIRWLEPLRVLRRRGMAGLSSAKDVLLGRRTHWHFPSWVEAEKRLGTRSAFYFVARKGSLLEYATGTPDPFYDVTSPRFRQLFRYLTKEGFEIGLHASYRAFSDGEKLTSEKGRLQEAAGTEIRGNRHHYWHLDPDDPESTLLLHERAGFAYDASLVHERHLGWRRGTSWPYFPFHHRERRQLKTLQIATAWMDDQLFGYRRHNPGERRQLLRQLADRVAKQGGCLLVDVHDYVFDDALFPGWRNCYLELWEYLNESSDFWFATPRQVAEHWTRRYERIAGESHGLMSPEEST